MSAVLERAAPACTTDISQNGGKSVATIKQFLLQHPTYEHILAIGAGPFRVNFHTVACPECVGRNLLRHYRAKTVAIAGCSNELDQAQQRAQLAKWTGSRLPRNSSIPRFGSLLASVASTLD